MERSDAEDEEDSSSVGRGVSRLSLMERSRRVGVVSLGPAAIGGGAKRRLHSPLSPDSAIGLNFSDDETRKTARTDDDDDDDVAVGLDDEDDQSRTPSSPTPPQRTLRAPSVVISDYSDETIPCVTLDEIER